MLRYKDCYESVNYHFLFDVDETHYKILHIFLAKCYPFNNINI